MSKGPTKHGHSRGYTYTREYSAWMAMKRRCLNSRQPYFKHYGGRGIKVCERWINSFETFLADMGSCPTQQHTLDRIDNNGNYEPGNCRWATRKEQASNTSLTVLLKHNGREMILKEWAKEIGIGVSTLSWRIRQGWDAARALTTPPRPLKRSNKT